MEMLTDSADEGDGAKFGKGFATLKLLLLEVTIEIWDADETERWLGWWFSLKVMAELVVVVDNGVERETGYEEDDGWNFVWLVDGGPVL